MIPPELLRQLGHGVHVVELTGGPWTRDQLLEARRDAARRAQGKPVVLVLVAPEPIDSLYFFTPGRAPDVLAHCKVRCPHEPLNVKRLVIRESAPQAGAQTPKGDDDADDFPF